MQAEYVVGIDGGGTKTVAAIAERSGKVLGTGSGGPSNYDDVGVPTAQASIAQAVREARNQAGLAETPFTAAFLGMAGVVSDKDRAVIAQIAGDLKLAPAAHVAVDHDCRIALAGGLSGRPGIVLIAGTGSSCYGRRTDGKDWRAGGWGYLMADEGSSYWLGVQALRSTVMAHDGRLAPTLIAAKILSFFNITDINDIMHRIYMTGFSRADVAALAPLVIQAAGEGDALALELVDRATQELASCVQAVAHKLDFRGNRTAPVEVALVGGMLNAGQILLDPLVAAIQRAVPFSSVVRAELPPVLGACLLALATAGVEINQSVKNLLRQTA